MCTLFDVLESVYYHYSQPLRSGNQLAYVCQILLVIPFCICLGIAAGTCCMAVACVVPIQLRHCMAFRNSCTITKLCLSLHVSLHLPCCLCGVGTRSELLLCHCLLHWVLNICRAYKARQLAAVTMQHCAVHCTKDGTPLCKL